MRCFAPHLDARRTTPSAPDSRDWRKSWRAFHKTAPDKLLGSRDVWKDMAHAIFNMKEFVYLR